MKVLIKMILLIISLSCITIGLNNISHAYEMTEEKYDKYISELPTEDDNTINIPAMVEEYYVSTSIKEIIVVYVSITAFGMVLFLILINDFIKWINTWEK